MPRILTTQYTLTCPHGGIGTINSKNVFLQIGNGFALTDGDIGLVTLCSAACCLNFTLVSMKLNSLKCNRQHVILNTDTILTNVGFPMVATPPAFSVVDRTAPVSMLNSSQKLPEYLDDESAPILIETSPPPPDPWKGGPYKRTIMLNCKYLGDVEATVFSEAGGKLTPVKGIPPRSIHRVDSASAESANHKIIVSMEDKHHKLISDGPVRLMVRAASKRGVCRSVELSLTKTAQ
jgi:hypothetical protein